jgi:hypothetical protein
MGRGEGGAGSHRREAPVLPRGSVRVHGTQFLSGTHCLPEPGSYQSEGLEGTLHTAPERFCVSLLTLASAFWFISRQSPGVVGGGEVVKTMYTYVSKSRNDKIKF